MVELRQRLEDFRQTVQSKAQDIQQTERRIEQQKAELQRLVSMLGKCREKHGALTHAAEVWHSARRRDPWCSA